ncbi:MAG: hypothetical protein ACUVTZ_04750 [Armatimonadota bacterium]
MRALALATAGYLIAAAIASGIASETAPYPPSPVITGAVFDPASRDRRGLGSDN